MYILTAELAGEDIGASVSKWKEKGDVAVFTEHVLEDKTQLFVTVDSFVRSANSP